jgi:hypothetical protein
VAVALVALVWLSCGRQGPTGVVSTFNAKPSDKLQTAPVSPADLQSPASPSPRVFATKPAGAVIFDQGPTTGTQAGCWSNVTASQNFAEKFSFAQTTGIAGIHIFTCIGPRPGTVHVKILANAGSNPGTYLYEEDTTPDSWVSVSSGIYKVTVFLTTPFNAAANTTYWIGVSGNGFELGQLSVRTPGDGTMAQFRGRTFFFHTSVGDMMFQLFGAAELKVDIDIKPGSFPNSINRKSNGNVPVALLSSATFDATTADRSTVKFAGASPLDIGKSPEDVNGDGLLDVVFHFDTQSLSLPDGTTEACLTGKTTGGQAFKGCDSVRLVK